MEEENISQHGNQPSHFGQKKNKPPEDPSPSLLLDKLRVDERDELDLRWEKSYSKMKEFIANAPENQILNILIEKVSINMERHTEVSMGLLYGIITQEASLSASYFQYLHFVVRDGFSFCISQLHSLIFERYPDLRENCKIQLLWLVGKLVEFNVNDADSLCSVLLRQISGGDISQKNLWLINNMLDIFEKHRNWLLNNSMLVPLVCYTFLRLIPDHTRQLFDSIREREISLCIDLLRKKFSDCMIIGRDLVRLLQDISKISEFEQLWKDITFRPSSLAPNFTGINQLFSMRTPRRYLQSRLTPTQESYLMFILKNVKYGNQKRYQTWFAIKYLNTPESESLIVDFIRFICCCYHPSNVVLSSDIIPRYVVVGWLLTCIKTPFIAANAKLALFYDWLFFDSKQDNLMNIEPGMLLIIRSIPKYNVITGMLAEFLVSLMDLYDPSRKDMIKQGIYNSLTVMLSKGVIPSLAPLFCTTLDPSLTKRIINALAPFYRDCKTKGEIQEPLSNEELESLAGKLFEKSIHIQLENHKKKIATSNTKNITFHRIASDENLRKISNDLMAKVESTPEMKEEISESEQHQEEFADEEETKLFDEKEEASSASGNISQSSECVAPILSIEEFKLMFDDIASFQSTELMNQFLEKYLKSCDSMTDEMLSSLGAMVVSSISQSLADPYPETEGESIVSFLFSSFQKKWEFGFLRLLRFMVEAEPSLSYRFLYHLLLPVFQIMKVKPEPGSNEQAAFTKEIQIMGSLHSIDKSLLSYYEQLLESFPSMNKEEVLIRDLKLCNEFDLSMFFKIIPLLFRYLGQLSVGNNDLIHLVVSTIDANQLYNLTTGLMVGDFSMFGHNISYITEKSLEWETFEQYCVWQLISAELALQGQNKIEEFINRILSIINPEKHQEAMSGILTLLRSLKPSLSLLKIVLCKELVFSNLAICTLSFWNQYDSSLLMTSLDQLLRELSTSKNLSHLEYVLQNLSLWKGKHLKNPLLDNPKMISQIQGIISSFQLHQFNISFPSPTAPDKKTSESEKEINLFYKKRHKRVILD